MSHPRSRPAANLLTQEIYESGAEITRKTGITSGALSLMMSGNLSKILAGEMIDRRKHLNASGVYMNLDSFQEAISNGERIEIEEHIWRTRGFESYNAYAKTVVGSSKCSVCGRVFSTNPLIGIPKSCSKECKQLANPNKVKTVKSKVCRGNFSGNRNKMIGDFGEAFIMSELLYAGYCAGGVDREGLPYDLLIHTEEEILRVQVKTTASTKEYRNGDLSAHFDIADKKGHTYAEGSVDLFALVHAPSKTFWIIPASLGVERYGINVKIEGEVRGKVAKQFSEYRNNFKAFEGGVYEH